MNYESRQRDQGRNSDYHDDDRNFSHYFSRRMPLNFFAAIVFRTGFLTAINSPDPLLRLVQAVAPPSFVFSCVRFFTAPFRALSPTGLFTAITVSLNATAKRGV